MLSRVWCDAVSPMDGCAMEDEMSVYIMPIAVWLVASVPFSLAICRLFGNRDFDE